MLIFEEDHLSFKIAEAIAKNYIIDYMRKDFEIVSKFMHFVLLIVKVLVLFQWYGGWYWAKFSLSQASDRELYNHMEKAKLEPFFATSWLITWFAHDIGDTEVIARVFDALLCSPPIFCYYVSAAVRLHVVILRPVLLKSVHLIVCDPHSRNNTDNWSRFCLTS